MKTDVKSYMVKSKQNTKVGITPIEAPMIAPAEETERTVHRFLFNVFGCLFVQSNSKIVKAADKDSGRKKLKVVSIKKKAAKFSMYNKIVFLYFKTKITIPVPIKIYVNRRNELNRFFGFETTGSISPFAIIDMDSDPKYNPNNWVNKKINIIVNTALMK